MVGEWLSGARLDTRVTSLERDRAQGVGERPGGQCFESDRAYFPWYQLSQGRLDSFS